MKCNKWFHCAARVAGGPRRHGIVHRRFALSQFSIIRDAEQREYLFRTSTEEDFAVGSRVIFTPVERPDQPDDRKYQAIEVKREPKEVAEAIIDRIILTMEDKSWREILIDDGSRLGRIAGEKMSSGDGGHGESSPRTSTFTGGNGDMFIGVGAPVGYDTRFLATRADFDIENDDVFADVVHPLQSVFREAEDYDPLREDPCNAVAPDSQQSKAT